MLTFCETVVFSPPHPPVCTIVCNILTSLFGAQANGPGSPGKWSQISSPDDSHSQGKTGKAYAPTTSMVLETSFPEKFSPPQPRTPNPRYGRSSCAKTKFMNHLSLYQFDALSGFVSVLHLLSDRYYATYTHSHALSPLHNT